MRLVNSLDGVHIFVMTSVIFLSGASLCMEMSDDAMRDKIMGKNIAIETTKVFSSSTTTIKQSPNVKNIPIQGVDGSNRFEQPFYLFTTDLEHRRYFAYVPEKFCTEFWELIRNTQARERQGNLTQDFLNEFEYRGSHQTKMFINNQIKQISLTTLYFSGSVFLVGSLSLDEIFQ